MTGILASAGLNPERDEQARRAVKAFRAMQPTLTAYARIVTKRRDIRVELATSMTPMTDDRKIYYRPPIEMGDNTPHDRSLCDKRDSNKQALCKACGVREKVLVDIFHEIGHIAQGTFEEPAVADVKMALDAALAEAPVAYAERIKKRFDEAHPRQKSSLLGISNMVNEYLPYLVNCLEDARVDREMFKARKGLKVMFDAEVWRIFEQGMEGQNRETVQWKDNPQNTQIMIGAYCKAAGYDVTGWFIPPVEEALADDELTTLIRRIDTVRSANGAYQLAFSVLARIRELGFCATANDPEPPQPEPEPSDEGEPHESPELEPEEGEGDEKSEETNNEGQSEADPEEGPSSGDPADSGESGEGESEPSQDSDEQSEGSSDSGSESDQGPDRDPVDGQEEESENGSDLARDLQADTESESSTSEAEESGDQSDGQDDESGSRKIPGEVSEAEESGDESDTGQPSSEGEDEQDDSRSEDSSGDQDDDPESGSDDSSSEESELYEDNSDSTNGSPEEGDSDQQEAGSESESSSDSDSDGPQMQDRGTPGDEQVDGGTSEELHNGDDADSQRDGTDALGSDSDDDPSNHDSDDGLDDSRDGEDGHSSEGSADESEPAPSDDVVPDEADGTESGDDLGVGSDLEELPEAIDTGSDDGMGGTEVIEHESWDNVPMGEPRDLEEILAAFHAERDENTPKTVEEMANDEAVDRAIVQGTYFETPSRNIYGVREHEFGNPIMLDHYNVSTGWDRFAPFSMFDRARAGQAGEFETPESILGPALLEMRNAFADNQRGSELRHRKGGKIDGRVLGKRAPMGDERLFKKKILPGKKNYFVLIGMDISGSTLGHNIYLEKKAVFAQCELLDRMGIKFAVYAHTGDYHNPFLGRGEGLDLDIYFIKSPDEPWTSVEQERLTKIGPAAANLDGHSLEYYRKILDAQQATDKIILYYTDGQMPAENHDEELEILQREIRTCKNKGYTLLGVGIRTDSPIRHGLDTVQVDEEADIVKVVKHLEKRLV